MESLWRKQIENLSSDLKTEHVMLTYEDTCYDVVVIGAGMAGLLTAYFLKEQGKRVIILEADKVASGQTEKTTAKITSQQGLKYSSLITEIGKEKAGLYAKANEEAIGEYEKLIKEKGIDCGFERVPAFLYSRKEDDALKKEAEAAALLGINSFFTLETQLPFPVAGALCFINQAQFSPLEFAKHIASELKILENTKVIKVKSNRVITEDKTFLAKKVVVATHYQIFNVPGFYFLRQHQERSYVLALSGCEKIKGMYYGIDKNGLSLRQAGELLLLGGGGGRTGENENGGAYDFLEQSARQ